MNEIVTKSVYHLKEVIQQKINYISKKVVDEKVLIDYEHFLKNINITSLHNDAEKKAFWINTYNTVTILFIIKFNLIKSMKEMVDFFSNYFIQIDEQEFCLDDIEHGILRKQHNGFVTLQPTVFDNRIHFVLNCGGLSCPLIVAIEADEINEQLEQAKNDFVKTNFFIQNDIKTIECSAIFDWYKNDFENEFLLDEKYKDYTINILPYNWNF